MVLMKVDFMTHSYAEAGLKDMMRVGSGEHLNVVVQLDDSSFDAPERLLITRGRSVSFGHFGRNGEKCDSRAVVGRFLEWAQDRFPARRYLLILKGHSYGLGFGRYPKEWLTISELRKVLSNFKQTRPGHRKLDVLGFSSCTRSYAEAAYELHDAVHFMVAPQSDIPSRGWPYANVLREIRRHPSIGAAELSRRIPSYVVASFKRRNVAVSALNLSQCPVLAARLKELTDALRAAKRYDVHRASIDQAFSSTASMERVRPLIDMFDFCANLSTRVDDRLVVTAARAVQRLVAPGRRFLFAHASRGNQLRNLHGLGIFAPHVTTRKDWNALRIKAADYMNLKLMRATGWAELVNGM
jgi:cysteine peptidase C11 family protein